MKKPLLWLLIMLLTVSMIATFSLAGCKKEAAPVEEEVVEEAAPAEEVEEAVEEEAAPVEIPKIGYITRLAVPWWVICEKGFSAAGADFSFKSIIYDPPQLTVEDQVRVMETWIAAGLDGIMIGPNDPAAVISVIDQAIDAGIPVVTGYGVDSP